MKDLSATTVRITKAVHEQLKQLVRAVSAELNEDVTLSAAIQYLLDLKVAQAK